MAAQTWRYGTEAGDVANVADLKHRHAALRALLVQLCSSPVPDQKVIDETIDRLAETQLVLKAAAGLQYEDDPLYH